MSPQPLSPEAAERLEALVRPVPDYPEPGVVFRDITPLLADGDALASVVDELAAWTTADHGTVDLVAGMEARGFILGAALALRLGVGFVPLRKAGKLPPPVESVSYALEYGEATLEVRTGTVPTGARVLVVDDVLATGGTAAAAAALVERCGAEVVAMGFLLEITGLGGRDVLGRHTVEALFQV
ncbi:adenine phosphoribosyltransferase [Luteimicrobium subarcticum]|uniref:Adenine phosphoribosyltransferase n=1 Tax=Luteimicrobium subarcticum TaxID=620910 RepID=A0A2M8W3Z5_9MICO|nr:adenine phosphoribosyltransferase [Luteimicrobium subarcticum]PJI85645.1 adenine phosphoribosyltransferase [Luteimicrobium subarcticum]